MDEAPRKRDIPTVATVTPDGELVELLYDAKTRATGLAVGLGEAVSVVSDVELPNGSRLVPWNPENNLIKHSAVLLPERPDDFGGVPALLAQIDDYLARYIDLSPDLRRVIGGYVLLTWVYDRFDELPYLRFRGDLGSGKTRALITVGSICKPPCITCNM